MRDVGRTGTAAGNVSVPFNAGRGLMPDGASTIKIIQPVSVPFNAGRGLMHTSCSTVKVSPTVSVPFNAGRGLMPRAFDAGFDPLHEFQYPSMRVVD